MPEPRSLADILALAEPLIRVHATDDSPNECVGMIHPDGTITRLVNQARSPKRFSVSREQIMEAITESKRRPIGLYHSHPTGKATPSPLDKEIMASQSIRSNGLRIPFVILGIDGLRVWTWHDGGAHELDVKWQTSSVPPK